MTTEQKSLQDAIARNVGALLSLPSAGMLRHYKSRFLAAEEDGFLLECPSGEIPLIQQLIADEKPCGVAFRSQQAKMIFAARIREIRSQFQINDTTSVEAVKLDFPSEIKSVQRRANYRVHIPLESDISARVWRISERAYIGDQPMSQQEIKTELRDVSVGGLGVTFLGKDGKPPQVTPSDRLRIMLSFSDQIVLVEGHMRSPSGEQPPEKLVTGIQFHKLETDIKGRQTLAQITHLVGELQREEVRRMRLGLLESA